MMSEPVAWRVKSKHGEWLYYDEALVGTEALYTHPADESFDRTASHMAGEYVGYSAETQEK